ncbi:NAD(P)-dependent oxidoreductase [Hymenobacter nivis]|uniref:NAD(P)-dependent oxidoreductase n=1 Tax=Hymenobacter nivis TaxID=1850093 RepID=A0A2Z3GLQ2_9BACT|nr:NAD(P)-dependent oxidoreductase [Hymenobacter nivis]
MSSISPLPLLSQSAHQPISVLGGGWLGLPLAQYLQVHGYEMCVSRTSAAGVSEVSRLGLNAFAIELAAGNALSDSPFWHAPTLLITVPPQPGKPKDEQLAQFERLIERARASGVRQVLYISSTSVYGDNEQLATEDIAPAPTKPGGMVVYQLEQLLQREPAFRTTVLRFGGLIGYDRLPDSAAAIERRRRAIDTPMNVIHRDDCVRIIHEIVRQQAWGEVFNASADAHPTRRAYYAAAARARDFTLPDMGPVQPQPHKVVSSEKLKARLNYQFLFPNPLAIFEQPARDIL